MGHFLYMLPGDGAPGPKKERFDLHRRATSEWKRGGASVPLDADGRLCEPDEAESTCRVHIFTQGDECTYVPENQVWTAPAVPDGQTQWWLGWWDGQKPGEEDLRRPNPVDGYTVTLADGDEWLIPPVRRWDGSPGTIPCTLTLGPDGEEQSRVRPEYRDLFEETEEFADAYYETLKAWEDGEREQEVQIPRMGLHIIVRVLNINYRVCREEVNALGLISSANRMNVSVSIIDVPAYIQMMADVDEKPEAKKKGSSSEGSDATTAGDDGGQN